MIDARVSLVGLGNMGFPIAERLLAASTPLTVWNRTSARAATLGARGAVVASTPAAAAMPITLTVLTDLADVVSVLDGPDGLRAGWSATGIPSPILVVHGTVSPVAVRDLAERLAEEGVQVVDAPLSGGVDGARSGSLSVMVGGEPAAVERVRPVFDLIGATVMRMGGVGAGQMAKACNQVVVAATVTALAEALVLADAAGLDRGDLLTILGGGLAGSEVLRQKGPRWLSRDFAGGGSTVNQLKDLRFVAEAAGQYRLDLPVAAVLRDVFHDAVDSGDGELDHSAIELAIARRTGGPALP